MIEPYGGSTFLDPPRGLGKPYLEAEKSYGGTLASSRQSLVQL